jgi:hypothetical protein
VLSINHVRTSASNSFTYVVLTQLTSHSLGQPYLLEFDHIGARVSRLVKKRGIPFSIRLFSSSFSVYSERRHFDMSLCIDIVTVTVFSARRPTLYD